MQVQEELKTTGNGQFTKARESMNISKCWNMCVNKSVFVLIPEGWQYRPLSQRSSFESLGERDGTLVSEHRVGVDGDATNAGHAIELGDADNEDCPAMPRCVASSPGAVRTKIIIIIYIIHISV